MNEIVNVGVKKNKKEIVGKVVSKKAQKTIGVEVARVFRHQMYGKELTLKKKFQVHDGNDLAKVGDWVAIEECAPISKTKHWKLKNVLLR